jgi:MFS family permease
MSSPDTAGTRRPLLKNPGFGRYILMRLSAEFAVQMQTVAVGWTVYDLTRNPLDLGLIGLSQFLPSLVLILVTGAVADRYPRNRIAGACLVTMVLCALSLTLIVLQDAPPVWLIYLAMSLFGMARAFYNPAQQSLLANLAPVADLARAVALVSSFAKAAQMTAPVVGGLLYAVSPVLALGTTAGLFALGAIMAASIRAPKRGGPGFGPAANGLLEGFRYMRSQKVVFGAISLDMVAVFLGGATALLPVFARDILQVGPAGLGLLYASSSAGSLMMALILSVRPMRRNVGRRIFVAVAVFGAGTIVFGLSRWIELSALALFVMGASDMVSMNLRQTLVQVWTPDHLRGRVSAINGVSVGVSNEVGQFRGGVVAALVGAAPAVIIGGVGTLVVVALWLRLFPQLAAVKTLERQAGPGAD